MRGCVLIIFAWYFMACADFRSGWKVVGPFANKETCEELAKWVGGSYYPATVSRCWEN